MPHSPSGGEALVPMTRHVGGFFCLRGNPDFARLHSKRLEGRSHRLGMNWELEIAQK